MAKSWHDSQLNWKAFVFVHQALRLKSYLSYGLSKTEVTRRENKSVNLISNI